MWLRDILRKLKSPRKPSDEDPTAYTTTAIPPMPFRRNSKGEYIRDKPWKSGGLKGKHVVGNEEAVERLHLGVGSAIWNLEGEMC